MQTLSDTYKIVRTYNDMDRDFCDFVSDARTIRKGLTLGEAQAHCRDERTATSEYFDGYMKE